MAWNEPGGGNQHDPWSGGGRNGDKKGGGGNGGGNGGPPDLDEALKKFQDKLNGMLGNGRKRRGGSGGGNGGSGGSTNAFALPGIIGVVLVAIWAASGFYLVDQSERGVVLRFGKYNDIVGPGLHWNPPIIDDVREINVTKVRSLSQTKSMLTQDENIVEVQMSVQYQVSNPRDFLLNVRAPEVSLENAMDSALRHEVGSADMNDILTSGRELLASNVKSRLQSYLDNYGVGLTLQTINVESTSAPAAVQDSFDDVIKAREDRQRTINQALAYENSILPAAQGQAQRIIEEAEGYKESVVAKSQGEANRFTSLLTEYQKAPEIIRERMYLETMGEVLGKTNKVLVDVENGNSLMYLPLDKLAGKSNATSEDASGMSRSELDRVSRQASDALGRSSQSSNDSSNSIRREGRQ
ncbi:FtsH protease activity modulator HflK [Cobetia marina]|jgi:membrane protease subunit HflK|uniref:Protein HflK n=2 Tax=Gammaproteobacteria TaxID=1236 RepID=A0ABU9GCJ8_COBMA|nr:MULTISPECIES: FtsH protease activity modulator HflK [Cobetia]AOM01855.1 HflK protein [Cobetia marina]MDA5562177.1 FtsH protease activity modulator HflK [Cobetia sp. MMG027]MDH2290343.1 FtsH protease activity modulator HflK [Cobetia sp. 10Alg 146]MDH2372266.1 FtsH protease activity modulator HflK [Cobetia sp. 3AK]MDI6002119.1 FtsH protease activity modulator HflK [Cobetia pacifica]